MNPRRFVKIAVVWLACMGALPWPWADSLIKRWNLGAL